MRRGHAWGGTYHELHDQRAGGAASVKTVEVARKRSLVGRRPHVPDAAAVRYPAPMDPVSALINACANVAVHLPGFRRDLLRKRLLRTSLRNPQHKWISIETLARAAALTGDPEKTRDLLISIGARPSRKPGGREMWALIDRAGP